MAASYINICIANVQQAVEDLFKPVHVLNIVNENVVVILVRDFFLYELQDDIGITQNFVPAVIQGYFDDVVIRDTAFGEMVMKEAEQKI